MPKMIVKGQAVHMNNLIFTSAVGAEESKRIVSEVNSELEKSKGSKFVTVNFVEE
jgi:hypothetical protein